MCNTKQNETNIKNTPKMALSARKTINQEGNNTPSESRQDCLGVYRRGVVVTTTAQLHSTKLELTFCVGSTPARVEDLWQWS